jgi:hypothetical protein
MTYHNVTDRNRWKESLFEHLNALENFKAKVKMIEIEKGFVWHEDFTYICNECGMFVKESKMGDIKGRENHKCTRDY